MTESLTKLDNVAKQFISQIKELPVSSNEQMVNAVSGYNSVRDVNDLVRQNISITQMFLDQIISDQLKCQKEYEAAAAQTMDEISTAASKDKIILLEQLRQMRQLYEQYKNKTMLQVANMMKVSVMFAKEHRECAMSRELRIPLYAVQAFARTVHGSIKKHVANDMDRKAIARELNTAFKEMYPQAIIGDE
jgi:hypothetical protein